MAASSSSAVAPMTSVSRQEIASLQRQVQSNSLYNRQLSSICQVNGLRSTGVKAELQRRICTRKSILTSSPRPMPPCVTHTRAFLEPSLRHQLRACFVFSAAFDRLS
jgi:hypothetical protein